MKEKIKFFIDYFYYVEENSSNKPYITAVCSKERNGTELHKLRILNIVTWINYNVSLSNFYIAISMGEGLRIDSL